METVAELVLARYGDDRPGLKDGDQVLSDHRAAAEAAARAAFLADLLPAGREPHVGLLLANVPEYPLWLSAAALAGASTRRGAAPSRPATSPTPSARCW
ncbi:MAG: steroid-22-oyl-CoA synthetase [Streptomyces sp.]|nr:steroid-22-oyl-CoA synthetase [Streptomyces sp.]